MTARADILAVAIPQIKRDEGLSLVAYPDPISGGVPWTIGYGQTGPDITEGTVWTEQQAEDALTQTLGSLCDRLDRALPWWTTLNAPRAAVLLNLAYNIGVNGLLAFKHMLAFAEVGNYSTAADEMLDSRWAKQVPNRAARLAGQMESGIII